LAKAKVKQMAKAMLPALEKNLEKRLELEKESVPERELQLKFLQWHLMKTPMPGPGRLTRVVADDCA
jgi:hypothetical protein